MCRQAIADGPGRDRTCLQIGLFAVPEQHRDSTGLQELHVSAAFLVLREPVGGVVDERSPERRLGEVGVLGIALDDELEDVAFVLEGQVEDRAEVLRPGRSPPLGPRQVKLFSYTALAAALTTTVTLT
jgi:hypothetical protein